MTFLIGGHYRACSCLVVVAALGCRPAAAPIAPADEIVAVAAEPAAAAEAEPAMRVRHDVAPSFQDPQRREKLEATFPELRRRIEAFAAAEELPGLAVGVVIDEALALVVSAGVADLDSKAPVTEQTVFRIASLTKLFTATAILGLRDQGKLSLDDPASRYVAELDRLVYPTGDARKITIRDLLLHTSGLPRLGDFKYTDPKDPPTRAEIVGSLDGFALRRAPGLGSEYSNLGFMLLGLVVEGATGEDYTRAIAGLGIERAAWSPGEAGAHLATGYARREGRPVRQDHWDLGAGAGAGGLYLNIVDLARFAALHLGAWPARDAPETGPVRRSSLREMAQFSHVNGMQVGTPSSGPVIEVRGQGLGWSVRQDCRFEHVLSHNGGTEGYTSRIELLPHRGVGVVLLTNVNGAPLEHLGSELLEVLEESGALATRQATPLPALAETVAALAGLLAAPADGPSGTVGLAGDLVWAHETLGACRDWRPRHVAGPDEATYSAVCERGRLSMHITMSSADPPTLAGFELGARGVAADPKIVAAARQVVKLLSRWDAALYAKTLAPTFRRESIRLFLNRVNPEQAACKLGAVEEVQARSAVFQLRCGARELQLKVGNVDAEGRIGGLQIGPAPRDRCGNRRAAVD